MTFKLLQTSAVAALVGLASINTHAASIWLDPVSQDGSSGIVNLNLYADASDVGGFLAGGLDLFYDSTVLTYNGDFAFDAAFPTDLAFSRLGDDCAVTPTANCAGPGEINGIAFGNFNGIADAGPTLVGSLSFNVLLPLSAPTFLTMADNDLPAGAWYATDGSGPLVVDYGSAEVSAIPVPAAVWLFGSGLLGLVGVARRRK